MALVYQQKSNVDNAVKREGNETSSPSRADGLLGRSDQLDSDFDTVAHHDNSSIIPGNRENDKERKRSKRERECSDCVQFRGDLLGGHHPTSTPHLASTTHPKQSEENAIRISTILTHKVIDKLYEGVVVPTAHWQSSPYDTCREYVAFNKTSNVASA